MIPLQLSRQTPGENVTAALRLLTQLCLLPSVCVCVCVCVCVGRVWRPLFVVHGKRILASETIPGHSNGDEQTELSHAEPILARLGQTRQRLGGGAGGGTEYLLCEGKEEANLSATGQSLTINVCLCVSSWGRYKGSLGELKGMIWLRGSDGDESGNRKWGRSSETDHFLPSSKLSLSAEVIHTCINN